MKVTDLRKKLLAALAAAGMLTPAMARAANFNTNLAVNPGFENVNVAVTGAYNAPLILDWTPSSVNTSGFAYSHDGSQTCTNCTVPDYARKNFGGSVPPNSGHWYFTSNRPPFTGVDYIDAPGEFYQDINVSSGDSATFIAANVATFNLSAYMNSYHSGSEADFANAQVEFRSDSGASLGTALVSDNDSGANNVWNQNSITGTAPVGTATVRLSLYGTKKAGAGPDGYIDNVDFHLSLPKLAIVVDRSNGNITLKNLTGGSVNMSAYSITSAFEAMSTTTWTSIADNYDAGSPGPNQVDAAHNWTKLTAAGAHTDLSEVDFDTSLGANIPDNRIINLGNSDWIQNPNEDLVFQYISSANVQTGIVVYTGNNGAAFKNGDFNVDGVINAADWVILRTNQLTNLSGQSYAQAYRLGDLTGDKISDHADFVAFKSLYDVANGSGSFASMLLESVPEPSSILLVLAAGTIALVPLRRRLSCRTYKIIFANS